MIAAILDFIVVQLLQALITTQMIKDSVLELLKLLADHTKGLWEKQIYNRVKFYFKEPDSEHIKLEKPEDENK